MMFLSLWKHIARFQKCNVHLDFHQQGVGVTISQPVTFQAAKLLVLVFLHSVLWSCLQPSQTGPISFSLIHPLHAGHPAIREKITRHKNGLCMWLSSSLNCSVKVKVKPFWWLVPGRCSVHLLLDVETRLMSESATSEPSGVSSWWGLFCTCLSFAW